MRSDEIQTKFEKTFKDLCGNNHPYEVWRDFVVMAGIAISNQCDLRNYEAREAEYMAMIAPYAKNEKRFAFSELMGLTFMHFQLNGPSVDFLGEVYMRLGIGNQATGQFFTPMSVTQMMGRISVSSSNNQAILARQGYISVCDPAVGAGACLLGALEGLYDCKVLTEQIYMEGWDIDRTAAMMAYIQLTACNIAAKIVHGNTLSQEVYSVWYTPAYILGGWSRKLAKKLEPIEPLPKDQETVKLTGMEAIRASLFAL